MTAVQANAVDVMAPGSISLATFTADVATAWASDFGGVIQFDATTNVTGIDAIDATYGTGQCKTLRLTNGDSTLWSSGGSVGGDRTSISGDGRLGKDAGTTNDFVFDISSITEGVAGEAVLSIGVTALSRSDRGDMPFDVTATFSDGSTAMLSDVVADGNGTDDTFFGFAAPAGLSITNFALLNDNSFTSLEDLAFITGVPVPEPTSLALLSIGVCGTLAFRRKRAA